LKGGGLSGDLLDGFMVIKTETGLVGMVLGGCILLTIPKGLADLRMLNMLSIKTVLDTLCLNGVVRSTELREQNLEI
jgi:hypothetical protein